MPTLDASQKADLPSEIASRTFVLHITPERPSGAARTVEMRATQTLAELHRAIQSAFEHEGTPILPILCTFCMSGRPWAHIGSIHADDKEARRTALHTVGLRPGKLFLYLSDFEELRYRIVVASQGMCEPDVVYPRLRREGSEVPSQDSSEELAELAADLTTLTAEVVAGCEAFAETESARWESRDWQRSADKATLLADIKLARRLVHALAGRPEQVQAIDQRSDSLLFEWLSSQLLMAAGRGLDEEALSLHGAWANLLYPHEEEEPEVIERLGDRVQLLLVAGRKEEALAVAEQRVARNPEAMEALTTLINVFLARDDLERATEYLRRSLELARRNGEEEDVAIVQGTLATILHRRGHDEEAAKLERELDELIFSEEDGGGELPPCSPSS